MSRNVSSSSRIRLLLIKAALVCAFMLRACHAPAAHAATISVTTLDDTFAVDGKCSLREAIRAANLNTNVDACAAGSDADTISLPSGTFVLGIAGSNEDQAASGDLDITGDLNLTGAVSDTTVIDGGGLDRVLDIVGAAHVTISQLTVRNGFLAQNDEGGGIRNSGTLRIDDSIISGNTASDFGSGGGLRNSGTLTITNSIVAENSADIGGGIENSGTLNVQASKIRGNIGGGISNTGAVELISSVINNNSSNSSGGGIASFSGVVTLRNSLVSQNTAEFGGGIRNSDTLAIINSRVDSNSGEIGAGVAADTGSVTSLIGATINDNIGRGINNLGTLLVSESEIGRNDEIGIFNDLSGTAILTDSIISSNGESGLNNRGSLALSGSAIVSNTTSLDGGGINNSGVMTVTNATVSSNQAHNNGGGLANSGTVTLHNVTVTNNLANSSNDGLGDGGGIYNRAGSQFALADSLIGGNRVSIAGVAVDPDCLGSFSSLGYNLIGDAGAGCMGFVNDVHGDQVGDIESGAINPWLGSLGYHGGPTPSHLLLPQSPAIDTGHPADPGSGEGACALSDQRGIKRPQGTRCDIGAVERTAPPSVITTFEPSTITLTETTRLRFVITNSVATNAITGIRFTDVLSPGLQVAAVPATTSTCGGVVDASPGATTIRVDINNLAAGATCAIDLAVTSRAAGLYSNWTSPISSIETDAGNPSNRATLIVNNPLPSISELSPQARRAETITFTLTITGSNFVEGATVKWNGNARSTVVVSPSQITAVITPADLAMPGKATVTVLNPPPGGGSSDPLIFTILNPEASPPAGLFFLPLIRASVQQK